MIMGMLPNAGRSRFVKHEHMLLTSCYDSSLVGEMEVRLAKILQCVPSQGVQQKFMSAPLPALSPLPLPPTLEWKHGEVRSQQIQLLSFIVCLLFSVIKYSSTFF